MAQDTALLRYLLKWARRAPWSWSQRDLTFQFDWTDDYISSNATIGRTGYDMNVSGNVTTGSDGDGSYIQFNGNRDATIPSGTNAEMQQSTSQTLNQTTSFTISSKFKFNWVVPAWWSMWIFGRSNIISLYADNSAWTNLAKFRIRNWATFTDVTFTAVASTTYTVHWVFDATVNKMYLYINGVLQNVWWTTVAAATFWWTQNFILWDWWLGWGNVKSLSTYIYHACIRNKALTQAEVDADIALWNTTKQDPSIVAYYVPENLQYNTQYANNPKDLTAATRAKDAGVTVTANTTVAPDGTTTADTVAISWATWTWFREIDNTITGATLASKTFIVKAFVKVPAATASFRLECTHWWVTAYRSSDLTATTTRQEFTFTQTFTSSTSWTSINFWLCNSTTWAVISVEVRNVRLFLVNETLRDESPNIWWFIGRKQNKVLSCRVKPNIDAPDSFAAQGLMEITWARIYIRSSSNVVRMRYDNRLWARESIYTLWNWFRDKVHALWLITWNWSWWTTKLYINWILRDTDNRSVDPQWLSGRSTSLWMWRIGTTYFSWNIRDARIYTFTWSFTNADALAIYNWWEPTSAWVTKYLHYKPPVGEVWTTTQDQSTNDRDWTLNGGVTRIYL